MAAIFLEDSCGSFTKKVSLFKTCLIIGVNHFSENQTCADLRAAIFRVTFCPSFPGGGKLAPDLFQSEIAATNVYDLGGSLGEELGEESGEIFSSHFRASFAVCRMTHKSSPKIPPNLSLHVLRRRNFKISSPRASGVWGPQENSGFIQEL